MLGKIVDIIILTIVVTSFVLEIISYFTAFPLKKGFKDIRDSIKASEKALMT